MIEIDGSVKSGSGTLLRCGITLATLLTEELHMWNIRAGRDKPGLRHQHCQAVLACRDMSNGEVEGANISSMEIRYKPGKRIKGGHYQFDIGTGGSTTMLTSTLLPLACFADELSTFDISGGLFQDFAPSVYHMKYILFHALMRMGIKADLKLKRPGYAERGGGIIKVSTELVKEKIKPIKLFSCDEVGEIQGIAICSHLEQAKVSDRMAKECHRILRQEGYNARIETVYDTLANHEGAALAIWAETEACLFGSDRAGKKGRRAEYIGRYVANNFIQDVRSGAAVDRFLADQLIIYAALADGVTEYVVPRMTDHVETNLWLVEHILGSSGAKVEVVGNLIKIRGIGYSRR
jgi:RNA 3'-terminal phosphate cyclase (ATP)